MLTYIKKAWASLQARPVLILGVMMLYSLAYLAGNALPPWLMPKTAHRFWYFAVGALVLFWEAWWNGALQAEPGSFVGAELREIFADETQEKQLCKQAVAIDFILAGRQAPNC
ncbi:MAG: hypothetical protein KDK39_15005 [Leptospiraceae bacterium]|nr:hypothetical protein [Leptospiraceae bacterium]